MDASQWFVLGFGSGMFAMAVLSVFVIPTIIRRHK